MTLTEEKPALLEIKLMVKLTTQFQFSQMTAARETMVL
jgi:hypothetical protein